MGPNYVGGSCIYGPGKFKYIIITAFAGIQAYPSSGSFNFDEICR